MELTLELEEPLTLFRVLCDGKVSHTFDLLTLFFPEEEAVQNIVQAPEAYGKRLSMALFPPKSLARRTLERGPTRLLLVATHTAVAAVPWELTYGSADFQVRELSFERGSPPRLPNQTLFVSEGRQLFEKIYRGPLEDSRLFLADMLVMMAEIYHRIWHEQYIPQATELYFASLALYREQYIPLAKNLYFAALALYRKLGNRASEALTFQRLGDVSYQRWTVEPSLPFYNEAMALYRELGDHKHEALLLYELGAAYNRIEYARPAFEAFSEALPIFRELGDREHEALTLYNMAVDSYRIVSKQEAVELYREALALCHEVGGNEKFEVILLKGLVRLHQDLQQYEKALAVCEQLIQFEKGRSSGDGKIIGLVMKEVLLYKDLKRPAEALPVVDQLLTLYRHKKKPTKMEQNMYKSLLQQREEIRQSLSRTGGGRQAEAER